MLLPFMPACQPLLPGSMPSGSAAEAIQVLRRLGGQVLHWPQLPQLHFRERPLVQAASGFPGVVVRPEQAVLVVDRRQAERELNRLAMAYLLNDHAYGAASVAHAAGLRAVLQEDVRGVRALKGQVLGPISLAAQLTDETGAPLLGDQALLSALVQHVRLLAMHQEWLLGERGLATIICIEEPFLDLVANPFAPLGWPEACAALNDVFEGIVGLKGLVAGGSPDWDALLQTRVELAVADVYAHGDTLAAAAPALGAFFARDGLLGLALVPADPAELAGNDIATLLARLEPLLAACAAQGIARATVLRRAFVSANAPPGMYDRASGEQTLAVIMAVSARLQAELSQEPDA